MMQQPPSMITTTQPRRRCTKKHTTPSKTQMKSRAQNPRCPGGAGTRRPQARSMSGCDRQRVLSSALCTGKPACSMGESWGLQLHGVAELAPAGAACVRADSSTACRVCRRMLWRQTSTLSLQVSCACLAGAAVTQQSWKGAHQCCQRSVALLPRPCTSQGQPCVPLGSSACRACSETGHMRGMPHRDASLRQAHCCCSVPRAGASPAAYQL